MATKLFGYGLALLGLVGLVLSTEKVMKAIPFLEGVEAKYILIPALIMIGMGVILVMSSGGSSSKVGQEVPIYKGKHIVGYRVVK